MTVQPFSPPSTWTPDGVDGAGAWDRSARHQATRERVLARKTSAPLPGRFTTAVVGVSFLAGYPGNLHGLQQSAWSRLLDGDRCEPIPATLRRAPDNDHDPNAIEVHVPSLADPHIGHLPRAIAARLAPRLDAGEVWDAAVTSVRQIGWRPESPGVDIEVRHAG